MMLRTANTDMTWLSLLGADVTRLVCSSSTCWLENSLSYVSCLRMAQTILDTCPTNEQIDIHIHKGKIMYGTRFAAQTVEGQYDWGPDDLMRAALR